ncbi:MAG: hypothetical protein NC831_04225 [Candidatus Omnitrophica bacterium]|nr:hypothetical protein [Candidatus Omnitrophota bacterium]MCM8828450.1 hypothetical protein [Candidatus Omnitrophota bacterium]
MFSAFTFWDITLVAVVTVQAGILAYVSDPRKKSLVLVFPFPFTIATISTGCAIDATNVAGLVNLAIFTFGVWFFYNNTKVNIVLLIILFALLYCALGIAGARILPKSELAFWVFVLFVVIFALLVAIFSGCAEDKPYRTDLPLLIKIPIILVVIFTLVLLKNHLKGFMTVFPMVGVIAVYESRFMLKSVCRQLPVLMVCLASMMMVLKIMMNFTDLFIAFACGWAVFLFVLKTTGAFLWGNLCLKRL